MTPLLLLVIAASDPTFCEEQPTKKSPASHGRPANGSVDGAVKLTESDAVRVLPKRHKERCLSWGTPRLIGALERAGREVQKSLKASPALGVGNIGRPKGGSLAPYSHSHQAGRDCDLAFYRLDESGPIAADDLEHFDATLKSPDGRLRFDVPRNWALVKALLTDEDIDVKWLFVSNELKAELLAHARKVKTDPKLLSLASEVLHQPSDAPPHDDHFHLRIRCSSTERDGDCVD
ncbi:MAG: penicillin-insensitive murein endopeptidase [Archangium sp.]|nr:penicillin-insensitive murein endopeptidase [Archangium sp.]